MSKGERIFSVKKSLALADAEHFKRNTNNVQDEIIYGLVSALLAHGNRSRRKK